MVAELGKGRSAKLEGESISKALFLQQIVGSLDAVRIRREE